VFLDLLSQIPMPETDQFVLTLNDITKLQEVRGVNPADFIGGEDAYFEYFLSLRGPSDRRMEPLRPMPAMTGLGSILGLSIGPDGRKYFGFDFRDIESTAVLRLPLGSSLGEIQITQGIISPSLVEELLSACEECTPPEFRTFNDTEYMAWPGSNIREGDKPPLFDAGIRTTRLIIDEGVVMDAINDEGIEALINVSRGSGESMADDEILVMLVTALDEFEALSVVISVPGYTLDDLLADSSPRDKVEEEEFATMAPLLLPYLASATGVGIDEDGLFNVIALAHESELAARENADRLRIRVRDVTRRRSSSRVVLWADSIDSVETFVEDNMLIARMRPPTGVTFSAIIQEPNRGLNLLIHE
jgi:hypothetical protein